MLPFQHMTNTPTRESKEVCSEPPPQHYPCGYNVCITDVFAPFRMREPCSQDFRHYEPPSRDVMTWSGHEAAVRALLAPTRKKENPSLVDHPLESGI